MNDLDIRMTAADSAKFLGVSLQFIHKKLKLKKLESFKSQNRIYFGHSTAKKLFNIQFPKKVISFQIVKGGTGKTSLTHAFAIRANLYGARVLCVDLDQQGNLSQAFNVDAKDKPVMIDIICNNATLHDTIQTVADGLDILPSRIENAVLDNYLILNKYPLDRVYNDLFSEIRHKYDLILIDCPPALGQSVTSATLSSDVVICPITPEHFSLSGLKISYEEIKTISQRFKKSTDFKVVLNKFDNRTALSSEVLSSILNHDIFKDKVLNTFIRNCQDFPNSMYTNSNIFSSLRNSAAKEDIDLLTQEILELQNNLNN